VLFIKVFLYKTKLFWKVKKKIIKLKQDYINNPEHKFVDLNYVV